MHSAIKQGGEGASTHPQNPRTALIPPFVVMPVFAPLAAVACDAPHEIYRLAYEWARVALRPSAYELATTFVAN
jgi:hypothetical protein